MNHIAHTMQNVSRETSRETATLSRSSSVSVSGSIARGSAVLVGRRAVRFVLKPLPAEQAGRALSTIQGLGWLCGGIVEDEPLENRYEHYVALLSDPRLFGDTSAAVRLFALALLWYGADLQAVTDALKTVEA